MSSFCPKCSLFPTLEFQKNNIHLHCACGYDSTLPLKEYLSSISQIKLDNTKKNEIPSDIISTLTKGKEHIDTYFKELKDKLINKIETAYKESFERNNDILTLLNKLIDNYNGDKTMYSTIVENSKLKIKKCEDESDLNSVVSFFNEYEISRQNAPVDVSKLKEYKLLIDEGPIYSLLLLPDGRIAAGEDRDSILIINPKSDYKCDEIINTTLTPFALCLLSNGNFAALGKDGGLQIFNSQTFKKEFSAKGNFMLKGLSMVGLPNDRVATATSDQVIRVWKSAEPYGSEPITTIKSEDTPYSLVCMKEKNLLVVSYGKVLTMYGLDNYAKVGEIEGMDYVQGKGMCQIDKDRVGLAGYSKFMVVNIETKQIEVEISEKNSIREEKKFCLMKLRDNNTLLCGFGCDSSFDRAAFIFCDVKGRTTKKIDSNIHNQGVLDLVAIDEETFVSCSNEDEIKVWKY